MCGINGHAVLDGLRADVAAVQAMNEALRHRGPDDGGVWSGGFAALGMRRLSIVDVAGGRQPMTSEDGRWTLVYNGEIYDFGKLRAELESRGERFRTRSDTEVLLNALREHGERALERLNGMFAFALVDTRDRSLLLARDVIGIKPLYYHHSPRGELVFSSELASLLAHPSVPRRLDRRSLGGLLVDRYVADPGTLLEDVRQLPPGHLLRWKDGRVEIRRFAELTPEPRPIPEPEALRELQHRLDEVVRSQLVADVPVGVFLSGGVDSSTVAAYAARAAPGTIDSFSVGFSRPDYDESRLARDVARHLGLRHHEVRVEDAAFDTAMLDRVLDHVGQPLADASCIPTWIVSRLASEHVKVVLSGDGGDEFFGGYDHMFWAARVRRVSERAPVAARHVGRALLAGVATVARGKLAGRVRRARKGLDLTFLEPAEQFRLLCALWTPMELRSLLDSDVRADSWPGFDAPNPSIDRLEPEEYAMATLARTFLPGAILTKVDRMSMAAGLEVRVPLLDRRIVQLALRLPLALKVRGGIGKHLLREAGRDLLPASVYTHKKQGFSIPLSSWLNREFWDLLDSLYAPGTPAAALFQRRALDRVLASGRHAGARAGLQSESNAATRVWLLAMLGRWMERWKVAA